MCIINHASYVGICFKLPFFFFFFNVAFENYLQCIDFNNCNEQMKASLAAVTLHFALCYWKISALKELFVPTQMSLK